MFRMFFTHTANVQGKQQACQDTFTGITPYLVVKTQAAVAKVTRWQEPIHFLKFDWLL